MRHVRSPWACGFALCAPGLSLGHGTSAIPAAPPAAPSWNVLFQDTGQDAGLMTPWLASRFHAFCLSGSGFCDPFAPPTLVRGFSRLLPRCRLAQP